MEESYRRHDLDHILYGNGPFPESHPNLNLMSDASRPGDAPAATLERRVYEDPLHILYSEETRACVLHLLERLQQVVAHIDRRGSPGEAVHQAILALHNLRGHLL